MIWFQSIYNKWRHQAVTWNNVDLSSIKPSDIHLRAITQEIPQPLITEISLQITCKKFIQNSRWRITVTTCTSDVIPSVQVPRLSTGIYLGDCIYFLIYKSKPTLLVHKEPKTQRGIDCKYLHITY